jgi:hypothetical protein
MEGDRRRNFKCSVPLFSSDRLAGYALRSSADPSGLAGIRLSTNPEFRINWWADFYLSTVGRFSRRRAGAVVMIHWNKSAHRLGSARWTIVFFMLSLLITLTLAVRPDRHSVDTSCSPAASSSSSWSRRSWTKSSCARC